MVPSGLAQACTGMPWLSPGALLALPGTTISYSAPVSIAATCGSFRRSA